MTRRRSTPRTRSLRVVGWREWVAFPTLGLPAVKAKVDTGARTSCLHAWDVEPFERDGRSMVRFNVHPLQRDDSLVIATEAPLVDRRKVTSSVGHSQVRPVILTTIELAGERWEVELTLTRRDVMGFRMLLGRQALKGHFVVDPGRSFYAGVPGRPVDPLPRVEPPPGPTTTDQ
jgi:hypothetical protein